METINKKSQIERDKMSGNDVRSLNGSDIMRDQARQYYDELSTTFGIGGIVNKMNTGTRSYTPNNYNWEFITSNKPLDSVNSIQEMQESLKKSWQDELNSFEQIQKKKTGIFDKEFNQKKKYNGKIFKSIHYTEALSCLDELIEKDITPLVITGSLGLILQKKISRESISDIDIICPEKFQLDDDMHIFNRNKYEKNDKLAESYCFIMNNMFFDVFDLPPDFPLNTVKVNINGKEYICQDYRDIIMAKFNMILPKMKDSGEIMEHLVEIVFK